jgi:spore coat polysaccharide biosynthesis protein SpsF (cytidylyltransferase family)/sialic acid synthase SpsE
MNAAYNILEIANVHAGDYDYMMSLLDEYKEFSGKFGIKFQPFKYDKIALPDFSWYEVYKQLYFNNEQWKEIISKAAETKDIWIDTFDEYTFDIAKENLPKVYGFKFQSSILYNLNLINLFSTLDLSEKIVMLNIAGIELSKVKGIVDHFTSKLKPKEIILQIGFQAYPTKLIDSGLSKIKLLKEQFNYRLCFADHIDPALEDAYTLPVTAYMLGTDLIEKHIRLSGEKPKYDFYSSMDLVEYKKYLLVLKNYSEAIAEPYLNSAEANYLKTTVQIPVLNKSLAKGSIPDINHDFAFRRSNQIGLRANEVQDYLDSFHVLGNDKKEGETLQRDDFKKANIGAVIACRMKSSRLPQKAIKNLGEITSVERCIKGALSFKNVNITVLATSDVEEDAILENYTYSPQVKFFKGHPLDVMKRVLDVLDKYCIDIFIRITADMPYVSNDILEILLESHFKNGADYTKANHAAIGTNLEIINTSALRKAKSYFPNADYSEYMTYYFTNNPEHFKLNFVDLPSHLVRDYRLTLDYPEDLEMFNKIQDYLAEKKQETNIQNIFQYLDEFPEVAKMNAGMEVKYYTDKTLIDTLNKFTKIK